MRGEKSGRVGVVSGEVERALETKREERLLPSFLSWLLVCVCDIASYFGVQSVQALHVVVHGLVCVLRLFCL